MTSNKSQSYQKITKWTVFPSANISSYFQIGEVNSAIELLKQSGAAPIVASQKWMKLYPTHCNDFASQACYLELFDHDYYNNKLVELNEIKIIPKPTEVLTYY